MSVIIAFYLGMSVALTASYYARIWDEAGEDEAKQKSAIRKAIFFPYFLLAMPVIMFPAIRRRLRAYHDVIFDEEDLVDEPLTSADVQEMLEEERPKLLKELREQKDYLDEPEDAVITAGVGRSTED